MYGEFTGHTDSGTVWPISLPTGSSLLELRFHATSVILSKPLAAFSFRSFTRGQFEVRINNKKHIRLIFYDVGVCYEEISLRAHFH